MKLLHSLTLLLLSSTTMASARLSLLRDGSAVAANKKTSSTVDRSLRDQDTYSAMRELFHLFEGASMSLDQLGLSFSMPPPEPRKPFPKSCEVAYAYCGPEVSTCFIGSVKPDEPQEWGWSNDLEQADLCSDKTLVCDLYTRAFDCNLDDPKANLVGTFVIAEDRVQWNLNDGLGGINFSLYAGMCEANDKGNHLKTGMGCGAGSMEKEARVAGTYPLSAPDAPKQNKPGFYEPAFSTFVFDDVNHNTAGFKNAFWADNDYEVFPLKGSDRRYLSAHATVCPCGDIEGGCLSLGPDGQTLPPTSAPTTSPPVPAPPTFGPTDAPTFLPTSSVSPAPSAAPTTIATIDLQPDPITDGSTGSGSSKGPSQAGMTTMIVLLVVAAVAAVGFFVFRRKSANSAESVSSGSDSSSVDNVVA